MASTADDGNSDNVPTTYSHKTHKKSVMQRHILQLISKGRNQNLTIKFSKF